MATGQDLAGLARPIHGPKSDVADGSSANQGEFPLQINNLISGPGRYPRLSPRSRPVLGMMEWAASCRPTGSAGAGAARHLITKTEPASSPSGSPRAYLVQDVASDMLGTEQVAHWVYHLDISISGLTKPHSQHNSARCHRARLLNDAVPRLGRDHVLRSLRTDLFHRPINQGDGPGCIILS